MEKLNAVVLGDGLLGSEIVRQTHWDYISRRKDKLDVSITDTYYNLILPYDIVVNCIANTDTYSNDKESHWLVNYKFVNDLISFCNTENKKIVHISTDYIYTYSKPNATEEDVPVHNVTWYGYTKLLSDGLVQLLSKDYLLCRCGLKPTPFPYEKAWNDQIGRFDYVDKIASLIIQLIDKKASGVYNVGTDIKSIYDLAKMTKPDVERIISPTYVPKDLTIDISKMMSVIK